MGKWRLFFITIISFIAILGENWVKKIIPISLCILLNSNSAACYINVNDGRVDAAISNINLTDNSINKILTFNQYLPIKQEDNFQHKLPSQLAIPPIIRPAETNLYIQNALPQDFRISSQIPYSSGKQEILLVSPSTGAEQLYTFNVPGSRSFQLFEVEYKKVSAIDFSSLTNTDSLIVNPEQIKSVLNKFKITFANNSLSKITLSDGTTGNFSPGQAIIKSPQGQTLETVQISQNEFIDQNILLSQERGKMNKNIENNTTNKNADLLAKTSESACQAAVSSSLNGISDSLGLWGNKLTTSKSLITKSVGWAISFGSGAIKSNISTKNPMLQEVNCRPPVQCEEQRVSGGSEIRTDLFQVAKGVNRKVNLKFEFFEIPDRIELYFDGKQIFGVGPKSDQGNETFDLPTNAEYVGVKLIGNDDVNTRWWYVISCSGSEICKRRNRYTDIPMKTTVNINSSKIEIIPRSQWYARSPITNDPRRSYERYQEPLQDILDSIVIHHAGNDRHETMRDVQNLHMDKKEAADIRYHFGIDKKGRIFEGRDIQVKGAHVEGNNTGKIGIVFLADLDEGLLDRDDELTPEMEQSLLNLINYLKNKYPKIKFLGGHNEFDTRRNCPGNIVEEKMPIWRIETSLCSLNDHKCPTTIIPKGN